MLAAVLAEPALAACSDSDPYYWQGDRRLAIYDQLVPMMSCSAYAEGDEQAMSDRAACNWFAARGLEAAFGISDFTPQGGGWKNANQIAAILATSPNWTYLGEARQQDALAAAARAAADGRAVVAAQSGSPHGHVALVLAGPLTVSGSWNLQVPNSASMFLDRPQAAFVGCKLSYAFQQPANVKLYSRK